MKTRPLAEAMPKKARAGGVLPCAAAIAERSVHSTKTGSKIQVSPKKPSLTPPASPKKELEREERTKQPCYTLGNQLNKCMFGFFGHDPRFSHTCYSSAGQGCSLTAVLTPPNRYTFPPASAQPKPRRIEGPLRKNPAEVSTHERFLGPVRATAVSTCPPTWFRVRGLGFRVSGLEFKICL